MKILYVVTHGHRGGAQTNVLALAGAMKKLGHEVAVGTGESGWLETELEKQGVPVVRFKNLKRSWDPITALRFIFEFRSFVNSSLFDIVHFHSSNSFVGILGLVGDDAPYGIATVHGLSIMHPGWQKSKIVKVIYKIVMKFLLRESDRVIFVSEHDKILAEGIGLADPQNSRVIYNGIPGQVEFCQREKAREIMFGRGLEPGEIVVGTVARLEYSKNLDLFIAAAEKLRNRPFQFVVLGSGPEKERSLKLIRDKDLSSSLKIIDNQASPARLIPGFDIFVLSSRYEGLPYTLLEAALAKTPVVATRIGGVPELVEHEKTGRLAPSEDALALSEEISYLAEHKEERENLADSLYWKVLRDFSEAKMIQETLAVYQETYARKFS